MRRKIYETTNVVDEAAIQVVVVSRHVWTCLNMFEHVKTYSLYEFFVCARKSYSTSELICLLLLLSLYEWMWNVAMVNVRPVHTRLYINISSRRFEMCLGRWSHIDHIYCDVVFMPTICFQSQLDDVEWRFDCEILPRFFSILNLFKEFFPTKKNRQNWSQSKWHIHGYIDPFMV